MHPRSKTSSGRGGKKGGASAIAERDFVPSERKRVTITLPPRIHEAGRALAANQLPAMDFSYYLEKLILEAMEKP